MTELRQRMLEELQRRNFASTTIRGYIRTVRDFAAYFHKPPGAEDFQLIQTAAEVTAAERRRPPPDQQIA